MVLQDEVESKNESEMGCDCGRNTIESFIPRIGTVTWGIGAIEPVSDGPCFTMLFRCGL